MEKGRIWLRPAPLRAHNSEAVGGHQQPRQVTRWVAPHVSLRDTPARQRLHLVGLEPEWAFVDQFRGSPEVFAQCRASGYSCLWKLELLHCDEKLN